MKALVFDSGPIISLSLNRLLWLLQPLKERFGGEFYITRYVHEELVGAPLKSHKYKLEALQVEEQIRRGVINVVDDPALLPRTRHLLDIANAVYRDPAQHPVTIVQLGEISSLALACHLGANAVVVDERATRDLIEDPHGFAKRLYHRLGTHVTLDREKLAHWKRDLCDLKVIRSFELAAVAFERGLLDRYIPRENIFGVQRPRHELLDAILWGIKLGGCSVSEQEIRKIVKLDGK